MKQCLAVPFAIAAAMVAVFVSLAPAYAQQRNYVSIHGDDANPCSVVQPCRSFAAAIAKTPSHGEIDCLDTGEFFQVTIQKSITFDCQGVIAGITGLPTSITIAFDSFDPSDIPPHVILRHLSILENEPNAFGIFISGAGAASIVNIEDCVVTYDGNVAFGATGIDDERARGVLTIDNTKVKNNTTTGIIIASSNGSRRAVIKNTQVLNSGTGIMVGASSEVLISHSDISDNLTAGLVVSASTGSVAVDSSTFAHNGFAFQNSGTVRLSNSDVTYNSSGWTGTINTFTNNRFTTNGSAGPLVPIGTAVNPTGQQ
jgi:hypothetical protein